MGYSVGRWEGDALVVESNGFEENNWLDNSGHPGTEALRLTERFHRRDFGHIDLEMTIDDPKAYTKPWKVNLVFTANPDTDLIEYVCDKNAEKSQTPRWQVAQLCYHRPACSPALRTREQAAPDLILSNGKIVTVV